MIVQFVAKKMKEDILKEQYNDPMKIESQTIIMKELLRKMVQDRKLFKKLTGHETKKKKKRFRWEIPQGMSFTHRDIRRTITTVVLIEQFLQDYEDDFGQ